MSKNHGVHTDSLDTEDRPSKLDKKVYERELYRLQAELA